MSIKTRKQCRDEIINNLRIVVEDNLTNADDYLTKLFKVDIDRINKLNDRDLLRSYQEIVNPNINFNLGE